MSTTIPQLEPVEIRAGERAGWEREFADHPATEYSLQYRFRGPGPGADVTATADGEKFAAELTATATATFTPGRYEWQAWLTETADTDNKFVIATGEMNVLAGFVAAETVSAELRSSAEIALAAIDAALANAATSDQMEYEIETPAGRRRVKRMSREELIKLRVHYAQIVANERLAKRVKAGKPFARRVNVRMWQP